MTRPQLLRREWCRRIGSGTTAVHKGTAFEERSMKLLQDNLSMSLQRVGGKEDGGIDLQGWWWLPPSSRSSAQLKNHPMTRRRLRIIAQCKAEKKKISPKYVRELEGVMLRFRSVSTRPPPDVHFSLDDFSSDPECPLVALLVSESPFTKSTLLRAHSSPLPLFLLHIPPVLLRATQSETCQDDRDEDNAHVGSAFWNPALGGPQGVLKGEMEIRWERGADTHGRPGIWWRDRRLENWAPDNDIGHSGTKRETKQIL